MHLHFRNKETVAANDIREKFNNDAILVIGSAKINHSIFSTLISALILSAGYLYYPKYFYNVLALYLRRMLRFIILKALLLFSYVFVSYSSSFSFSCSSLSFFLFVHLNSPFSISFHNFRTCFLPLIYTDQNKNHCRHELHELTKTHYWEHTMANASDNQPRDKTLLILYTYVITIFHGIIEIFVTGDTEYTTIS